MTTQEKQLKRLIKLLRAQGVASYSDGTISLMLSDRPLPTKAVKSNAPARQIEEDFDPEVPDFDMNNPEHLDLVLGR